MQREHFNPGASVGFALNLTPASLPLRSPSPTTTGSTEGHSERGLGGEVCTFAPKVKCTQYNFKFLDANQ